MVVEAHLAKTDAALLAAVVAGQGALGLVYIAARTGRRVGWPLPLLFWLAEAVAILLKGPPGPVLALLTAGCLSIADRDIRWVKRLRPLAGDVDHGGDRGSVADRRAKRHRGSFHLGLAGARPFAKAGRRPGIARRAARLLPGDGDRDLLAGLAFHRSGADLGLAAAPRCRPGVFCSPGWVRPGSSSSSFRPSCRIMSCRFIRRWRCSPAARWRKGLQNISRARRGLSTAPSECFGERLRSRWEPRCSCCRCGSAARFRRRSLSPSR